MQRIMIAGTGSGCGKTTVTCAVLSALRQRGVQVSAFKCGPDYIDPMFYREILGTPSHNLDSFFCGREMLCGMLADAEHTTEIAVIEGVMGFYDGGSASAYSVSEMTETPVILVLNCRGMKESLGAVMQGFLQYQQPNRIAGFLFNRLPERLAPFAMQLCSELHTGYFGFLPAHSCGLESRHLGLVTAPEIADIHAKMNALGTLAQQHILLDKMLELKCNALSNTDDAASQKLDSKPVIAVSRDRAFCFLYEENLAILRKIGCETVFFSPLADAHLPQADGLILCGGYPELYAEQLAANHSMRADIRKAVENGMPLIAECGGFMYLHSDLQTESGEKYAMAGVIDGTVFPTKKLQRFGYVTLHAQKNCLLCDAGETLKAHEYHYWDSTNAGDGFTASKTDGRTWECCHITDTMYAGFPHLYFPSDIRIALRFAAAAANYGGHHETHSTD